jgi:hypothetical protein
MPSLGSSLNGSYIPTCEKKFHLNITFIVKFHWDLTTNLEWFTCKICSWQNQVSRPKWIEFRLCNGNDCM